jgi:AraC-like DNA-binding protein
MHGRSSDLADALPADPLSEVLQELRLTGVSYGRCELGRPWGIALAPQAAARFHFVAAGVCWMGSEMLGWIPLQAGDVALLPQGIGHSIADRPQAKTKKITRLEDLPAEAIGERMYRVRAGGRGARTVLACCSVKFEEPALHPLLELMPPVLVVRGAATRDATLPALIETMAAEVLGQRVGASTILTRLADVIVATIIRAWVETGEDTSGWLVAIRDPSIGRALAAIHRRPGERWSVDSLAEVARTSRSIFAERFMAIVGMPPARYLARGWLRDPRTSIAEVAARLGYDSEAAFSRAFKRLSGTPPSALRRVERAA